MQTTLPLTIPRWLMIQALAQTGRTARQIADELQIQRFNVYWLAKRAGVVIPDGRRLRIKTAGTIRVRHRLGKWQWEIATPPSIPTQAMRAAGLEKCRTLEYSVEPGCIQIRAGI